MHRIIRALGAALAGTALVASAGVTGASAAPADAASAAGGYQPPQITWGPCEEVPTVECGTLAVPVDWSKPRGETFDLAVARRGATDPAQRVGVMLVNPGGPGGSGVDFALGADTYFSPEVLAKFDVVGFDPRGVARSNGVRCSLDVLLRQPSHYPANEAEFAQLADYNRELQRDCREQTGPLYDHVSTLSVVEDVEAIRRSLGEKKISYYGLSYGTLIGQQYAEEHPDRIRAMVIDSNMDHSLNTRQFVDSEARTAESSWNEWVRWCDRTESCALHGQDVAKVWDGLLEKADRGEVEVPGAPGEKLTAQDISSAANSYFYGPAWKELAELVAELDAGTATDASAFTAFAEEPETAQNPFPAVFCQDWQVRVRDYREYVRLHESEQRNAPHMRTSALGHRAVTSCIGLGDATNPQHRLRISGAPKILMLNALYDPATAYEWAVNAHRQAGRATTLLTYEGWGHGVYDRSECTRGAVDGYLIGLRAPADGTRCAAVEPAPQPRSRSARPDVLPNGPSPSIPGWTA
ncbi:alpha/beta hydrolase [Umezawaea beigongshangensis]|uniref:alpha/beta hydrolase n=1 Tax=Umezawaea beigongshangensis TaxID=2780383 RepID=UPI0018F2645E|nr:alpha/beta hydrolase [Umezawaea beigongshangensis]